MPEMVSPTAASEPPDRACFTRMVRLIADAHMRAEEHMKATHGRFNLFTTLHRDTDEVRLHTRFLHALLDPDGTHDCGPLFLDLFFKMLSEACQQEIRTAARWPEASRNWKVRKEAGRSSGFGQMDLLLEHPKFGIAIENKIHAGEGKLQLASYAAYLSQRYQERAALFFLTLDGRESTSSGDARCFRISYRDHILDWLDACLRETYGIIPVNQALLQYREVVRKLTGKTLRGPQMKPIIDHILKNPDIVRYSGEWANAVQEAKARFMEELGNSIILALPKDFTAYPDPENPGGRFGEAETGIILEWREGERILPYPAKLYIENDGEVLALGVLAGYGDTPPYADLLKWAEHFRLTWGNLPSAEASKSNVPTKHWPLGWIDLLPGMTDSCMASYMEEGPQALTARLVEHIESYATDLKEAAEELARNIPASRPLPS